MTSLCYSSSVVTTINYLQAMTYKARLVAGLTALGYKPVATKSAKYASFVKRQESGAFTTLHVGKFGALRCGPSASTSYSVGDPANQTLFYLSVLNAKSTQS